MRGDAFARAVVLGLVLLAPAPGCAETRAPRGTAKVPSGPVLEAVDYRFTLDDSLNVLYAEVCFRGAPPAELVAGTRDGAAHLHGAWTASAAGERTLPVRGGRIQLTSVPRDGCVHYRVDLASAAASGTGIDAARRGDALVSNTALWLWRPPAFRQIRRASATFVLPEGMRVLVPWPARDGGYALDESAFAFFGFAAFGRFETERVQAGSAVLDVVVLEGLTEQTRAHVAPWLIAAARTAALPFGRLPHDRGLVVIVPAPSSPREPVRFGMAARGGGASLLLLVAPDAGLQELQRDWVAIHEFCHLMHPFVARDDAWLSEGLATYYQEVARVRAGLLPETEAWRRFHDGAELGREGQGSLVEQSARMFADRSFARVYWAGASFALLADVELRRRTHGRSSLDDVMRELARCCARRTRPVPAREVIAEMDRIAGAPVFSELMQRWALGPRLPDLSGLFAELGVDVGADGVQLAPAAQAAWIRQAIMGRKDGRAAAAEARR